VAKSPRTTTEPASLSFEDALVQIEAIIERIEAGEVGLEQSLAEYERGVGLINHCRSKLDRARQQVEDLTRKLQATDEGSAPAPASEDADEAEGAEPQF
jgi:exodeoxyribonuclease VII small subunit